MFLTLIQRLFRLDKINMMRKILLSLILISASVYMMAQPERMPFGDKSSYYLNGKNLSSNTTLAYNKSIIYSENFDSYVDNFASKWVIKRGVDLTGQSLTDATSPMWFLCKPTNFNGNGSTYIHSGTRSAAISYTAQNFTWLISSDTITIPAETGYNLNFWLWYYNNTYYQYITYFHVMVYDVDTQVWDLAKSWDETSGSNQYLNKVVLSLDEYSGKRIRLAFVYENRSGTGSQVAVDDISVSNSSIPDLTINGLAFSNSAVPLFIVDAFKFSFNAYVKNIGSKLEDTARINVTSVQLPDFISKAQITDTLEEGETRFVKTDSLLKFATQGHYKFVYKVEADQDEAIANNTDTSEFEVSPDLYATDYGIAGGLSLGMDQEFGNIYYTPYPCFISGVQIGWPDFATANFNAFEYELNIYELNPVDSSIVNILYSETILKEASQTNSYYTLSFNPIYCKAGSHYFVAVRQLGSSSIGIGFDKIPNGVFWKLNSGKGNLQRLANPTIGNVALRLVMKKPDLEPTLTFSINSPTGPVPGLDIEIIGVDTLTTDIAGQASIKLKNGTYRYNIYPANFAPIRDTVKILYQNVTLNLTLQKLFKAKFIVKSGGNPVPNAEILISDSLAVTNSSGVDSVYLVPKTYSYTVSASGYEPLSDNLTIANKDTIVNIALTSAQTYTVNFTVVDDSGNLLANTKVSLTGYGSKYTTDQGKVSFIGVKPATLIFYTATKTGYENGGGTIDVVDHNVDVDVELIIIRYKVTFYITNGVVGLPNAAVKLGALNTVSTDANGFAVVNEVIPATDIPYTITLNNFHLLSGKLSVFDSDIRENVVLTPLSTPKTDILDYSIFPNPTSGIFRISGGGKFKTSVYDLTGNLIVRIDEPSMNQEFDLSERPAGIYFIKIESQNRVMVKRVVKR